MSDLSPQSSGVPLDPLKLEILLRLRWSILGSASDILVTPNLDHSGTEKLEPFLSHPLAMESIIKPSMYRIQSGCTDISGAEHFRQVPENYQYELLTIENADGSLITIRDFVVQVHSHLKQKLDVVVNYRRMVGFNAQPPPPQAKVGPDSRIAYYMPGQHGIFFKEASSSTADYRFLVSLSTFMERESGKSAEAF